MKLRTLQIICLVFAWCGPAIIAQAMGSGDLFRIQVGGKIGYISQSGSVVIAPKFEEANDFSEGLAVVRVGESYGYIDRTGKFVFDAVYGVAYDFADGVALVGLNNTIDHTKQTWGLLRPDGNLIRLPKFKNVSAFSEGRAAVINDKDLWGYIDTNGRLVVPFRYQFARKFSNGHAAVLYGNLYGFVDRRGNMVIKPKFTDAHEFSEGLAAVKTGGDVISGLPFQPLSDHEATSKWTFIDSGGRQVAKMPADVRWVDKLSGGLAAAQSRVTQPLNMGFVDRGGVFRVPPIYEDAQPFSGGVARVVLDEMVTKFGFVDAAGKLLFSAEDTSFDSFKNGLARFQVGAFGLDFVPDKAQGYINRNFKVVWEPTK
jgi:hypothetical protein